MILQDNAGESQAATVDSVKQLRTLVHAIAISLLILIGTVFVYLYRQVVSVRKSTTELANYVLDYERSNASEMIQEVHRRMAEFRNQHPDFSPIYTRYFGTNEPPPRIETSTNAAKVVPAPVSPAQPQN